MKRMDRWPWQWAPTRRRDRRSKRPPQGWGVAAVEGGGGREEEGGGASVIRGGSKNSQGGEGRREGGREGVGDLEQGRDGMGRFGEKDRKAAGLVRRAASELEGLGPAVQHVAVEKLHLIWTRVNMDTTGCVGEGMRGGGECKRRRPCLPPPGGNAVANKTTAEVLALGGGGQGWDLRVRVGVSESGLGGRQPHQAFPLGPVATPLLPAAKGLELATLHRPVRGALVTGTGAVVVGQPVVQVNPGLKKEPTNKRSKKKKQKRRKPKESMHEEEERVRDENEEEKNRQKKVRRTGGQSVE